VEDDLPLCSFLRKGLESEHYAVDTANDGEQARFMLRETDYDLAVLDLNLPKMDGIEVLRYIRPLKQNLPILVLTSRSRVEDRVQGLDTGADDYLSKPFSFSELSARVRAILRRGRTSTPSLLRVADLALDRVERRVERAGKKIELTSKEFALLEYLMRNAGRRITRTMIVEHVWNIGFDTATNVVDVYINSVMRKIVERSLRQAGLEISQVVEASNGSEALELLKNHTVDLVLCDINMPVMDGLEFVREAAKMEGGLRTPVVMITTEGSESHVVQALQAGAKGYIRKPFTADQVKEQVTPLLERAI